MPTSKYQVRFLKAAEEDFTEIAAYIAADDTTAAEKLAGKIEKNLEALSDNSELGRVPRDEEIRNLGYRYLIVQNYLIFYTIESKTVFVHRVLYGARNYKTLL